MGGFLLSNNFTSLLKSLNISTEEGFEIKDSIVDLIKENRYSDEEIEKLIDFYLYQSMIKNNVISNAFINQNRLINIIDDYYYNVFIWDVNEWEEIKNKLIREVQSGKVNSFYLLDKSLNNAIKSSRSFNKYELEDATYKLAHYSILLKVISYLLENYNFPDYIKSYIIKDLIATFKDSAIDFNKIEKYFIKTIKYILNFPSFKVKNLSLDTLWVNSLIVEDEILVKYFDEKFGFTNSKYILVYPFFIGINMWFAVLTTCGLDEDSLYYYNRNDFSKNYVLSRSLINDDLALTINQSNEILNNFKDYIDENFRKISQDVEEFTKTFDNNSKFKVQIDDVNWEFLDYGFGDGNGVKSNYKFKKHFNSNNKPFESVSDGILDILSNLDINVNYAYEIKSFGYDNKNDLIFMINRYVLERFEHINKEKDLKSLVDNFRFKLILLSKEDLWDEIKIDLENKIDSNIIKNIGDLFYEFRKNLSVSSYKLMESNIKYDQIRCLLEFREISEDYFEELAMYLRDQDVFDNDLPSFLNEILGFKSKVYKKKSYCDEGKYPAPHWLVYPELSCGTIGWRMGYGEKYVMKSPFWIKELFPKPKNWLFFTERRKYDAINFKELPFLAFLWTKDGKSKYSKIEDDYIVVNDFITMDKEDKEFRFNQFSFLSITHALLWSKYVSFDKCGQYAEFSVLRNGFKLSKHEDDIWNEYKYTVCLNIIYYKIMNNDYLKDKLLASGNKCLVYLSDDEWGCKDGKGDNLLGFALMELRDEIRRLYKNEDKIDWEYTEFLK